MSVFPQLSDKIIFECYFEKNNKKRSSMMKWVDKKNRCVLRDSKLFFFKFVVRKISGHRPK